jgi:flavin-dependent dehydrogenase
MRETETIIVGAGPAGSTCARELLRHGRHCLVLERKVLPRPKLCAGWITPKVLHDLEIQPGEYPHGILALRQIRLILGRRHRLAVTLRSRQFSIRRIQFDAWLLARAGVEVVQHTVRQIRREAHAYVIDDAFGCRYLVGAGGTSCPVKRAFFPEKSGRLVITREVEYTAQPARRWGMCVDATPAHRAVGHENVPPMGRSVCTLWFPFAGPSGYGWYVPKADALNVGFGALHGQLAGRGLTELWAEFVGLLRKEGCLDADPPDPKGHAYHVGGRRQQLKRENAYLLGDAAGLATADLAEGIGPAVESGILAARDILGQDSYAVEKITRYSLGPVGRVLRRLVAMVP